MKKNNSNLRQKRIAILTLIMIVAVILYTVILEPIVIRVKDHNSDIGLLKSDLVKIKSDMQVKERVESEYEKVKELISSKGSAQQEISSFSTQLHKIYSAINLQIRSLKIMPAVESDFYRTVSIRIEFEGMIKDITKLISEIEAANAPVSIEQLQIKSTQVTDKVKATLLLSKITSI